MTESQQRAIKHNWRKFRLKGALATIQDAAKDEGLTNEQQAKLYNCEYTITQIIKQWPKHDRVPT